MSRIVTAATLFLVVFLAVTIAILVTRRAAQDATNDAIGDAIRDLPGEAATAAGDLLAGAARGTPPPPPTEPAPANRDDVERSATRDPGPEAAARHDATDDEPSPRTSPIGDLGGILRHGSTILKNTAEGIESSVLAPPPFERRREVGGEIHAAIMSDPEVIASAKPLPKARVDQLGKQVLRAAQLDLGDRYSGLSYTFTLLESPIANAFAHVGGYVYVNTGLLDLLENDEQLAFVLAHEIGHVECCHTCGGLSAGDLAEGVLGEGTAGLGMMLYRTLELNYSSAKELEADAFGYDVGRRLGVPPSQMKRVFELLDSLGPPPEDPAGNNIAEIIRRAVEEHFRSHPPGPQRIEQIEGLESAG